MYGRTRHVPEQMWYTHPAFAIALGGILPFGAVCIELFFIMSALWMHQVCLTLPCVALGDFVFMFNCLGVSDS